MSNLTPLLRAGITTFVCLQHELPTATSTSAHLRSVYAQGNVVTAKPYISEAQAIVDAGGFPMSGGPKLCFIHVPISEANGATLPDDELKAVALDLLAYARAGEYLYIQCGDGNGRSGTVAAVLAGVAHNLVRACTVAPCRNQPVETVSGKGCGYRHVTASDEASLPCHPHVRCSRRRRRWTWCKKAARTVMARRA